ncbi:MAG: hypothetical protein MI892_31030 [Desulfobacterales bacterium]|nr:hypothetical protein [Desulfobacterales bacterium]
MNTMTLQDRNERVQAVRGSGTINGIESVEITSASQTSIRVYFIHPLPGETNGIPSSPQLTADNILIEGGARITSVTISSVNPVGRYLQVYVTAPGDFSTYTLKLVTSSFDSSPPENFDPVLSSIDFSFKVRCPNDFDCCIKDSHDPMQYDAPGIDYLAKDYNGFRRLILNRMSAVMPQWQENNPADQQVMLAEVMAYLADQFSYYQDAVATEAYLGTSRLRRSLKRHTHLLDYNIHEGCNARTWVHLDVTAGGDLDNTLLGARTWFVTHDPDTETILPLDSITSVLSSKDTVFESLHDQKMYSQHNSLAFHTWSGSVTVLEKGITSADIRIPDGCFLEAGDVVMIEETHSPVSGQSADADREKRWAVRLVDVVTFTDPLDGAPLAKLKWHQQDALPFSFCLEAEIPVDGIPQIVEATHAMGNMVLVDHGLTVSGSPGLSPYLVQDSARPFRPVINRADMTYSQRYSHFDQKQLPAKNMLIQDPAKAYPNVWLSDGENNWVAEQDLLGSDKFSLCFVIEQENDGTAHVRFGDDIHGKKPVVGTSFTALFRTGNGPSGNVGAESITRIVTDFNDIESIRNPLAANGGTLAENSNEVKRNAPEAFKIQKRAVTESDWEETAMLHPEVQKAKASFRWTGSWYTVFITVDRIGGKTVLLDEKFRSELLEYLNQFRVMGYDLELRDPVFTSMDILLDVCKKPGYTAADILKRLQEAFGTTFDQNNIPGFFHPDAMTFGKPIYISELCARAHDVEGVFSVDVTRLKQWGKTAAGEIEAGFFQPASHEIIRCDSDPNFPEHGLIQFEIKNRD